MARKITVGNPSIVNVYKTSLSSAYVDGVTLNVLSNVSFAGDDLSVVGNPGEEKTELKTLDSLSGKKALTLTSKLNFTHPKDTPVFRVNWDFVNIEGRATTADDMALITSSPIQWDKLNTVYIHDAGTDTWTYRFRFHNSVDDTFSEYSPTIAASGFTRPSVGYMIRQVRQITNDLDGRVAGDRAIIRFFNEAQDIIRGVKPDWWFLKVTDTSVTTESGVSRYTLPASIGNTGNISDIRYNYDDGSSDIIYALQFVPTIEFDLLVRDQDRTNDDYLEKYSLDEADSDSATGYIRTYPTPDTTGRGTFHIRLHRDMTDLDLVDDETLIPIPALLEDFAIAQMEKIRGNENKSRVYEDLFYGTQKAGRTARRVDTGINLLEKLDNARQKPAGQPMSLKRFRGHRAGQRFYNNRFVDADRIRENYFLGRY